MVALLRGALEQGISQNIMLTGPMGCGKTTFVHKIAKKLGFGKVFQVNGSEELDMRHFIGKMAVKVDPASGQNMTYFQKGALYNAFIEGTKVDEDGNQVLDADGNPIVTGKPAIFFLDEFAAITSQTLLGVFNRALDLDSKGKGRQLEIADDGGRVVKAHPSMVVFLSGNTVGTGTTAKSQKLYTAQKNIMDESTLNRITLFAKFGYNRVAEQELASEILIDDRLVRMLMQLRDKLREDYLTSNHGLKRIFGTREVLKIANSTVLFRRAGLADAFKLAVKSVYDGLDESDKAGWSENLRLLFKWDFAQEEADKKSSNGERLYDYF